MAIDDKPLLSVDALEGGLDVSEVPEKDIELDTEPPYSVKNELNFFLVKGLPLMLSAMLEWGVPPLVAMVMAGHTESSASLQSALGFGRVFYNCTTLLVVIGLMSYFQNVIPGCVGANRKDRIPNYFRRSLCLMMVILAPFVILQF